MLDRRRTCAGLVVALMLLACPSPSEQPPAPARDHAEAAPPVPPVEPARNDDASDTTASGDTHSTETGAPDRSDDATGREVVRRRCKPGFSACNGGRDCCNDLFEVCARDNRCHPLE